MANANKHCKVEDREPLQCLAGYPGVVGQGRLVFLLTLPGLFLLSSGPFLLQLNHCHCSDSQLNGTTPAGLPSSSALLFSSSAC